MIDKITNNIKAIKEIADATQNLDLKSAILDLKEEVLGLREENLSLKQKLSDKEKYNMKFEDNTYYNVLETGEKEGPYCSSCWDSEEKAIRLIDINSALLECPKCKYQIQLDFSGPTMFYSG